MSISESRSRQTSHTAPSTFQFPSLELFFFFFFFSAVTNYLSPSMDPVCENCLYEESGFGVCDIISNSDRL